MPASWIFWGLISLLVIAFVWSAPSHTPDKNIYHLAKICSDGTRIYRVNDSGKYVATGYGGLYPILDINTICGTSK